MTGKAEQTREVVAESQAGRGKGRWLARSWAGVGWAGATLVVLGSPALAVARAVLTTRAETAILGRPSGAWSVVLLADAPLVGLVLVLGGLGFLARPTRFLTLPFRVLSRLAAVVLLAAQAADLGLLFLAQTRLNVGDLQRFRFELSAGLTMFAPLEKWFGGLIGASTIGAVAVLLVLVLLVATVSLGQPGRRAGRPAGVTLLFGALLLTAVAVPRDRTRFHGWVYPNVIAAILPRSVVHPYSAAFLAGARARHGAPALQGGAATRWNVVILIVESLSSSQSRFFSGVDDFTPGLDALARRGQAFTGVVANGFATHLGLAALLGGRIPLPPPVPDTGASFEGFLGGEPLPAVLAKAGYRTEYVTNSELEFVRLGEWLFQTGFATVRGSTDPAFATMHRFAFDAAPDEALVDLALSRAAALRASGDGPFLLVVETASSHLPWLDPTGRDSSERGVIGYVDRQVARLAQGLQDSGFLGSGMLVVTSDHRKMAPLSLAEVELFGGSAFARVPLLVLRPDGVTGRVEDTFQQADIPGSIECLLTAACPVSPWRGNLFASTPLPPRCVLYPMVNDRDLVWVRCGSAEGTLKLDGDRTGLVEGSLPAEVLGPLLDEVALTRVANTPIAWPQTKSGAAAPAPR